MRRILFLAFITGSLCNAASDYDVSQSIPAAYIPQEQLLHAPHAHHESSQPVGLAATPQNIGKPKSPQREETEAQYEQSLEKIPDEDTGANEGIYDISQLVPGVKIAREKLITTPGTAGRPSLSFGGYVKTDVFWDTRQVFAARDGHVLFYPQPYFPDVLGRDINKTGDFNFLAIQTRLWAKMTGPRIGSKRYPMDPSGYVEVDFLGVHDTVINSPRLRYAMIELHGKHLWILVGQYNHPLLVDEVNAGDVISFNTGLPYELHSRNPQIRLQYHSSKFRFFVAALAEEVDFRSIGPSTDLTPLIQIADTRFLRNSKIPILDIHVQGKIGEHVLGAGVDVRTLKPRLSSITGYKVWEHITSVCAAVYAKLRYGALEVKGKLHFTENPASYAMIGGYAIASVCPVTDQRAYTNLRGTAGWFEISYNKKIAPGIFFGFFKNLGAAHLLAPLSSVPDATSYLDLTYGRGTNINFSWRVSARCNWFWKSLQVGAEFEVTNAHYGNVLQSGKVQTTNVVTNYRPILGVFYYF